MIHFTPLAALNNQPVTGTVQCRTSAVTSVKVPIVPHIQSAMASVAVLKFLLWITTFCCVGLLKWKRATAEAQKESSRVPCADRQSLLLRPRPSEMDDEAKAREEAGVAANATHLLHLPDDMLYAVLFYCDLQSLGRLSRVCKRFATLIRQECVWIWMSRRMTIVHESQRNAPISSLGR